VSSRQFISAKRFYTFFSNRSGFYTGKFSGLFPQKKIQKQRAEKKAVVGFCVSMAIRID
jgi:hypothetical protein